MKLTHHKEDDALYLRLDDSEIVESEEVKKHPTPYNKSSSKHQSNLNI